NSPLTIQLALYAPSGQLLTFSQTATGATITSSNLPVTGRYTVLIRDLNGTGTGAYALTAVSIGPGISQNAGGDGGPIGSGETKNAAIGIGDIDVFTLTGNQGGALLATAGETTLNSPLTIQLELYAPSGQLLTFNQTATGTTITAA